ncbi:MAG: hypothetical protein KC486_36585 [Myxococcales bacterium]|nr:hypothetical protein [Myxococcales bacterium]
MLRQGLLLPLLLTLGLVVAALAGCVEDELPDVCTGTNPGEKGLFEACDPDKDHYCGEGLRCALGFCTAACDDPDDASPCAIPSVPDARGFCDITLSGACTYSCEGAAPPVDGLDGCPGESWGLLDLCDVS